MVDPSGFLRLLIGNVEHDLCFRADLLHTVFNGVRSAGKYYPLVTEIFFKRSIFSLIRYGTADGFPEWLLDQPGWLNYETVKFLAAVNKPIEEQPFDRVRCEELFDSGTEEFRPWGFRSNQPN